MGYYPYICVKPWETVSLGIIQNLKATKHYGKQKSPQERTNSRSL